MIPTILYVLSLIVILSAVAAGTYFLISRYLKLRGPRVVTCPADNTKAAVEVDALHALLGDRGNLHLRSCSHWPEREGCGQDCLRQIETSPDGCLDRNILAAWYASKSCVVCGKAFGEIDWMEHKPALMAQDQITEDWGQINPQELYETLMTHAPVCWNCHIALTFRRQHPELVTDRPWKK
jgi:hypothetical protein